MTDDDDSDDNNQSINSIINDDETSMAKIHFNTPEQRSQFIQWIGEIRQKYPENTITEAILAELDHHTPHPITEKVEPYTLLLSCKEEKEKYNELISDIENNPKYKIPPIITMIQNDKL